MLIFWLAELTYARACVDGSTALAKYLVSIEDHSS